MMVASLVSLGLIVVAWMAWGFQIMTAKDGVIDSLRTRLGESEAELEETSGLLVDALRRLGRASDERDAADVAGRAAVEQRDAARIKLTKALGNAEQLRGLVKRLEVDVSDKDGEVATLRQKVKLLEALNESRKACAGRACKVEATLREKLSIAERALIEYRERYRHEHDAIPG